MNFDAELESHLRVLTHQLMVHLLQEGVQVYLAKRCLLLLCIHDLVHGRRNYIGRLLVHVLRFHCRLDEQFGLGQTF